MTMASSSENGLTSSPHSVTAGGGGREGGGSPWDQCMFQEKEHVYFPESQRRSRVGPLSFSQTDPDSTKEPCDAIAFGGWMV